MDTLPLDLLRPIIDQLVLLHLFHPRKVCWTIPQLLHLRLVCHIFSNEISHSLRRHITLPNLPRHLITLPNPNIFHNPARKILASALSNSTSSLHSRHLDTTIVYRLKSCIRLAQQIAHDDSASRQKEFQEMLCSAASASASASPCGSKSHVKTCCSLGRGVFVCGSAKATWADWYCVAAMLGATDSMVEKARTGEKRRIMNLPRSDVFGDPLSCAVARGRLDTVRYLVDWNSWPYCVVDPRTIPVVLEHGDVEMLRVLLGAWLVWEEVPVLKYGVRFERLVVQAVKKGDVEIVRCVLDAVRMEDFRSEENFEEEIGGLKEIAFLCAVRFGKKDVVKLLVDMGVDVNLNDVGGVSALGTARERRFSGIEKILLENGARETQKDVDKTLCAESDTIAAPVGKTKGKKLEIKFWRF